MAPQRNRVSMTKTAVRHTITAFGVESAVEIRVSDFDGAPDVLATHLKAGGSSQQKVRNNKSFLRRLISWGRHEGLLPVYSSDELSETWRTTIERCRPSFGRQGATGWYALAAWASSKELEPCDLTTDELSQFPCWLERSGKYKDWRTVYHYLASSWRRASLQGNLPPLQFPPLPRKRPVYRVLLKEWPAQMQEDYVKYRKWATDELVLGRPRKYKQRLITADQGLRVLERMGGYFVTTLGIPQEELDFLMFLDKELVSSYLSWLRSERGASGLTLLNCIAFVSSIGLRYLGLKKEDLGWLNEWREQLADAKPRDRFDDMISLEQLLSIPDRLREDRLARERDLKRQGKKMNPERWARMVRNELIIRLLIARPLRSRNIREARLRRNILQTPGGTWWIRFEGHETKGRTPINYSFPENLVPFLRDYLNKARPVLAGNRDSDLVFISSGGRALRASALLRIVQEPCLRYFGKPVTVHLVRHIATTALVKKNPGDAPKASKLLGHASPYTTWSIYSHYTQDDAARSYDELLHSMCHTSVPLGKEGDEVHIEASQERAGAGCEARQLEKKAVDPPPSTRRANRQNTDNKDKGRFNRAKKPRTRRPVLPLAQDVHSARKTPDQPDQERNGSDPVRDPGNKSIQTKGQRNGRERKVSRRAQGDVGGQLSLPGFGLRDEDEQNG